MKNGVLEILALGDRFSAAYKSIDATIRQFGELTFREEQGYEKAEDVISYIRNSSFDLVLMPNPYGNERRRWVYQHLKNLDFPVIVFDRGALPRSWFFDTGFNADSNSYHPLNWDFPLTLDENSSVQSYIESIKTEPPLEEQQPAIGGNVLREQLGLQNKKVLFVPFQRPSDTTIKFFAGQIGSFENFTALIDRTSKLLQKDNSDWVVIAKKHPLEQVRPSANVMFVDDSTHIHDLIELCDTVLLVNSGVGVLSSLFLKPVLHAGDAFYSHPNLNRRVSSVDDVIYWLKVGFNVCSETRNRFIYHLANRIYSYGNFDTELVLQRDGAFRNITKNIDFETVRLPDTVKKKRAPSLYLL